MIVMRLKSPIAFGGICAVALAVAACSGSGGNSESGGVSGLSFIPTDAPWRQRVEVACLRSGYVDRVSYISKRRSLGGPSVCGAIKPLTVKAALGGRVRLKPAATLRCPMIPAIDDWLHRVVQPAAHRYYGAPVVELKVAASYSCRPRNNKRGAKLSEHGFANAIDISEFRFANGRKVSLLKGWRGRPEGQKFLRRVHAGACGIFKTVLGPNSDKHHADHFHFDLARHTRSGKAYCR